ncbi:MAG: ABC transporter permease subunit [Rhodospirillales bacterium]|nr:ABC transporter permease subunit [Rhodospirillales bacterium]
MMRHWLGALYIMPLTVFFVAVMVYPFFNMVFQGFIPSQAMLEAGSAMSTADGEYIVTWDELTLANYLSVFTDDHIRSGLTLSLAISVIVSFVSIFLCIGPAWLLVRKEFPGKRMFRAILTVPMAFSGIIIGFLAVIMIGRIGAIPLITDWLFGIPVAEALAYSLTGLGIAYIWFQIPRATLNLESAIRKFDWDLESAARSLGASPFQTVRYVLLPLLTPAIVSTMAVTFAVSMGSFGVALLLLKKATVLPLEIYTQMYSTLAFELSAALSVQLAVVTVGVNYFLRRYGERHYAFAS